MPLSHIEPKLHRQVDVDILRKASPEQDAQCKQPNKKDLKSRLPLQPPDIQSAVEAPFPPGLTVLVLANLNEAYLKDIRSPAGPGLWAHLFRHSSPGQKSEITRDL